MCAEDITEDVMLSTVAGAASLADFAEVVAADVTSLANVAMATTKATISAVAGAGEDPSGGGGGSGGREGSADAGIMFLANPAGVVTVGVAPLAVAGPWRWLIWPMLGYCSQPIKLDRSQ